MEKRKQQIQHELFILKLELNSFYTTGQSEVIRCNKIYEQVNTLRQELKELEENKSWHI